MVFVLACGDLDAGNHGQVPVCLSLHYTQQLTQQSLPPLLVGRLMSQVTVPFQPCSHGIAASFLSPWPLSLHGSQVTDPGPAWVLFPF